MDVSIELVFFFVFFIPMAIMVTMNLLLHPALPDIAAPWVRIAAPDQALEPQPEPEPEPVPAAEAQAESSSASNEEEALEAA
jgi:hypothetical protein